MIARLGRNTLWLLSMRVGAQGLMVLFTLVIARRLGEAGLGEYAFMAAIVFVANAFTSFGTDMLLIREIAAGGSQSRLSSALLLQIALSAVCVAAIYFGAPGLPGQSPDFVRGLRLYSLALLPQAFFTVSTTLLRGKQRMDLYSILNLLVSLGQLLSVWLFVGRGSGVWNVAVCLLLTQIAAAVLAGALCAVYIPNFRDAWRFSFSAFPALIRASAPIALLGLLGMTYQRLGVFLLATLAGAAATGWFSAALRAVEASKIIHLALFGALYPAMAQAHHVPDQDLQSGATFGLAWQWLLALAAAAAFGLFILAPWLAPALFGPTFEPSIPALKILAWMLIPYTINTYLSLAFLAAGREKAVAVALLVGLTTLTALTFWWIRAAGLVGACWAALVAEVVQSICLLVQQRPLAVQLTRTPERTP